MEKNDTVKGNSAAGANTTQGNTAMGTNADVLIRTILNSQDNNALKNAIMRIVELRDPVFVQPLTEMLQSNNLAARRLAAWALNAYEDQRARGALKAAISDPDDGVRKLAAEALKKLEANQPQQAAAHEKKFKNDHLEVVLERLRNDVDAFNRQAAARALGEIKDPRALDGLLEAMSDSDPIVRGAAALSMVSFKKDPRVFGTLVATLKDDDYIVRGEAALALGRLEDDRALDPLVNSLRIGKPELREKAAIALGELGDLRAIDDLRSSSRKDEKPEVRNNAKEALSVMAKKISKGMKDPDSDVREMTAYQLGKIQDPYPVPMLIEALGDEAPVVRENAAVALGQIGDKNATPYLMKLLKDKRGYVRKHTARALGMIKDPTAVDALMAAAKDDQWFVRADVAWALGQIGNDKALKVLVSMFNDPDRNVRQLATEAVQQFKNCRVSFMPVNSSPPRR